MLGQHFFLTFLIEQNLKMKQGEMSKVEALLKKIRVCMLSTERRDVSANEHDYIFHARPMTLLEVHDNKLFFFISNQSQKCQQLHSNSRVNCSFQDTTNQIYVSVSGKANIVTDAELSKRLWTPFCKMFFPNGLNDPDLAVLVVAIEFCEYWDPKGVETKSGTYQPLNIHTVFNPITNKDEISPDEMEHKEIRVNNQGNVEVVGYKDHITRRNSDETTHRFV